MKQKISTSLHSGAVFFSYDFHNLIHPTYLIISWKCSNTTYLLQFWLLTALAISMVNSTGCLMQCWICHLVFTSLYSYLYPRLVKSLFARSSFLLPSFFTLSIFWRWLGFVLNYFFNKCLLLMRQCLVVALSVQIRKFVYFNEVEA